MPQTIDQNPVQSNSPQIPEMQRLKEKYPVYKDIPDFTLLQGMAKKYPIYQKPFQEIASKMSGDAQDQVKKQQVNNSIIRASSELVPDAVYGLGDIPVGAALRRGWGAVQSTLSGDGPIKGFKDPDNQQAFGVSFAKAYKLDLNNPVQFTGAVVADVAANLATGHLLYGLPVKAGQAAYKYAQNAGADKLHGTLVDEFKSAGISHEDSHKLATNLMSKLQSHDPITLFQAERMIKGKLGQAIKDHVDTARTSAQEQGHSPEVFKKLGRVASGPAQLQDLRPSGNQINVPPRRPVSSAFEPTTPSVIPLSDGRKSVIEQLKIPLIVAYSQGTKTYYRASMEPDIRISSVNEPFFYLAEDKNVADRFAHNGVFGRPGAKTRAYNAKLNTYEPSTKITFTDFNKNKDMWVKYLKENGYDSIVVHELNGDRTVAVLEHGLKNVKLSSNSDWWKEAYKTAKLRTKQTPLIEADLGNPSVRHAISIDPSLSQDWKDYLLGKSNIEPTHPPSKQPAQQTPTPTKIGGAEPPPSLKTTPSTQPLPPYKNTPEINQRYLEYEKTAPDIHSMNVKDLKLSVVRSSESAMKLPKDVTKVPIMIDKDNKVIDGNHRLIRARLTGQKKINVISQPTQSIDPSIEKYTIAEKRLEKIRSSLTDKQLADISRSKLLKTRIIPVRLDELDKSPHIADEVLQRQGNQDPKVIEKAKQIKTIPTPEITAPGKTETPQTLKQTRLSDAKKSTEDYHPNTFWDVTFSDEHGNQNEMVDGPGLRVLEKLGYTIIKKNKLASEKGELNLEPLHDLLTNIHGELEKANNEFGYVAKTFGNSFFIGEKYPPFGKVIKALQDPIDESNEMFYNGVQKLNRSHGESLSTPHQERVNQALNYGDSQSVQKYFTPNELKSKFDLTPEEIKAYQGFVDMYKHGLDIVVKTRKLEEPDLQEGDIRNQLDRLGGYISHTRLGGDWAVYQPGDKEDSPPKFFDLFHNKSSAEKMSKTLDGSKVYLKTNIPRNDYGTMSIHDLQSLAEAQDVNPQSPDYLALKEELMKRSASKNWIRRNWVPRAEQSLRDKYDNAIDYLNGQTARYARVKGRIDAQKAMNENLKLMSPSLARYANKLIDTYHSGSSVDSNKIFQALNKTVYAYRLMFKTSFFLQHLTHPISVTYPELSKGLKGLDTEAIFFHSYNMSRKYALHKITGTPHGLSTDTINMMETLQHQGYLGDQLNKFQMDSRTRFRTGFEHFIGSMARVSEGTNRIHSAMAGMLKAYNLGINDPQIKLDFVKNFMKKTVFQYGKLYTPYLVTGSGSVRNILNTMYRFRSFEVNYLHTLASHFRSGVGASLRAIGGMTAMAGISGLPFYALLTMAYLWKTGHTLDNDTRQAMREAHIPDKVIDLSLHGVPSLADADLSSLIGTADIISPYGDAASKIGGPSVGFVEQMGEAGYYVSLGDRERALEKASPDFISRILRGQRYAREGIRKENGDTILANPSNFDIAISKLGIQPLDFTKAYQARDEKDAVQSGEQKRSAQYNTILAKKLESKDFPGYSDIIAKIQSYNKTARPGDEIVISSQGIKEAYARMINGKKYPRHMESVIQQINERYGIK